MTKETNEIQRLLTLKNNRNKRHKYRQFVIEGRLALDHAVEKEWKISALFYSSQTPLSAWAESHLKNCECAYGITEPLMEKISDKSDRSELVAIAEQRILSFADFHPTPGNVIVVLDEPKSPGNMGMMVRSAVAFGASALIISGHGADEYDPQCIRASVGTFFSLPIYRVEGIRSFSEKIEQLKNSKQVAVIASGDRGSSPLNEAHFDGEILFLVLGNETAGISVGYRHLADQFVQIPLPGPFTSLNIAAAGSIFLYEIFRRKNGAPFSE